MARCKALVVALPFTLMTTQPFLQNESREGEGEVSRPLLDELITRRRLLAMQGRKVERLQRWLRAEITRLEILVEEARHDR